MSGREVLRAIQLRRRNNGRLRDNAANWKGGSASDKNLREGMSKKRFSPWPPEGALEPIERLGRGSRLIASSFTGPSNIRSSHWRAEHHDP